MSNKLTELKLKLYLISGLMRLVRPHQLVTSLNGCGLREEDKRRSIFSYFKDQKSKLYFLQETYSKVNDEIIWRNPCRNNRRHVGLEQIPY